MDMQGQYSAVDGPRDGIDRGYRPKDDETGGLMDTPNFEGAHNHDRHRTVGPHRAWCYNCWEWCYPDDGDGDCWCACCHEAAGHVWMDPLRVSVEAIAEIIDGANDAYNDGRAEPYDLDSPIHPKIQVMAAAMVARINGED